MPSLDPPQKILQLRVVQRTKQLGLLPRLILSTLHSLAPTQTAMALTGAQTVTSFATTQTVVNGC